MLQKQINIPTALSPMIAALTDNHELEALFEKSQKQLEAGDYVSEEEVYAQLELRINKKLQGNVK